jgi:glycosyltransferase involved in cell wall biosynthesis
MSFCGKIEHRKGYDIAFNMGKTSGQLVRFAGPDNDGRARELGTWIGEITDHEEFCKFVGNSKCLLYPSRNDAGGMAIWEAMALGTPTITTDNSGAQCHVHDGITGFVVSNMEQALEAISNISNLNPSQIREMCAQEWDLNKTFENFYQQIQRFVDGERW